MPGPCLLCKRALGCRFLYGRDGRFDADRLFTPDSKRECSSYEEVAHRERSVRERMYKNFGLGYLRTLHELPELIMEGLRQGEKDELMYDTMPNFQDPTLLWEGMNSIEREDVLRHQTDENGQVVVEIDSDGVEHRLARPEFHLKAYVSDPDGPAHVERPVAWMWNVTQCVDHILKAEAELGLITKIKKPSAEKQADQQQEEEEIKMPGRPVQAVRKPAPAPVAPAKAAGRPPAAAPRAAAPAKAAPAPAGQRVNPKPPPAASPRGAPPKAAAPAAKPAPAPARAPAPAPAGSGKVANPPPRRVPTPAGAPGRPATRPTGQVQPKAAPAAEAGGGADVDAIKAVVFDVVNPMIEELRGLITESIQTTINCATILHDIAGQTGGTFRFPKLDEESNQLVDDLGNLISEYAILFPDNNKILSHVTNPPSAYVPENMHAVGEDPGQVQEGEPQEEAVEEVQEEVVEEEVPEGE